MGLLTASFAAFALFSLVTAEGNESVQLDENCGLFLSYKFFGDGNKTEFDDYPWMALLVYDTPKGQANGCGGVLLSKRYVLTAAHCVTQLGGNWSLKHVRLGEYDTETKVDCYPDNDEGDELFCAPEAANYSVDELIPHEQYDPATGRAHDVALIRLNATVPQFSDYLRPICLPMRQPIAQKFHVAGWGKLAGRKGSSVKLRSTLSRVNASQCNEWYAAQGVNMTDDQICAGNRTTKSQGPRERPCIADSGGPLMGIEKTPDDRHRMTVFGLLATDARFCDIAGWPAIFVDVLRYKDWILQRIGERVKSH